MELGSELYRHPADALESVIVTYAVERDFDLEVLPFERERYPFKLPRLSRNPSIIAGVVYDDAGQPAPGRIVRIYSRSTGAMLGQCVTDPAGAYEIAVGYVGEVQRIVLDDEAGLLHNDLIDRIDLP